MLSHWLGIVAKVFISRMLIMQLRRKRVGLTNPVSYLNFLKLSLGEYF